MKFTAATSENPDTDRAVAEITSRASGELDGAFPDLAFLFVTPHHVGDLERAVTHVTKELGARHLLGCIGESIVGGRREFEGVPAMVLWVGSFPDAHVESVHVQFQQSPDGHFFTGTPKVPDEASTLILLSDPFTFPADLFLRRCGEDYPRLQILGGMASGPGSPTRIASSSTRTCTAMGPRACSLPVRRASARLSRRAVGPSARPS